MLLIADCLAPTFCFRSVCLQHLLDQARARGGEVPPAPPGLGPDTDWGLPPPGSDNFQSVWASKKLAMLQSEVDAFNESIAVMQVRLSMAL